MIKNPPKEFDERIEKGDNFFMLSKGYLSRLEKLPFDVLKNMIIKLTEENKSLRSEVKRMNKLYRDYVSSAPRWDNYR